MRLITREDIEAPIEHVFREATDFQAFERSVLRRGADVRRTDSLDAPATGLSWHAEFKLRGKLRKLDIELTEHDPPNGFAVGFRGASVEGISSVDLVALSRGRTRMSVILTVAALNLSGRLVLQTLKLARGNLDRRFKLRVADFAMDVEDRYKRSA